MPIQIRYLIDLTYCVVLFTLRLLVYLMTFYLFVGISNTVNPTYSKIFFPFSVRIKRLMPPIAIYIHSF